MNLAEELARAGRHEEARALYREVAKAHPENAPALNNAAFFLADTGGDLDEALRLAKNALAKVPGQPNFSDTIGYIYLKKGMLDSAIQSFQHSCASLSRIRQFPLPLRPGIVPKGRKIRSAKGTRDRALESSLAARDARNPGAAQCDQLSRTTEVGDH